MNPHSRGRDPRPQSKTLRLCAQVERALAFALGDSNDPVLQDLALDAVEPLGGDGHLLVRVVDAHGHGAAALVALDRANGWLRSCVAAAISRRRAPQLSFTLAPSDGGGDG